MSLTIKGIIVSVVGSLLLKFGFSEICSNEIIQLSPVVIGGIISWIGRIRQGDVNILGVRKI